MQQLLDQLKQQFGDAVIETSSFRGDDTAVIKVSHLIDVCRYLQESCSMNFLMDVCGVDYPERKDRFEVVYHMYSQSTRKRIRLKVRVTEADPHVPTVIGIWKSANWFEREAFDLFGIIFDGHPYLRRLLTYEGFEGHALRKDYPVNKRQQIPTPISLLD
ncbi:MAG: NADH-quinone oxidoreductase subunit C [Deltaproteobacteria bacterium CG11_big_fil_rev_8_21_14_0_20_47_16]|nr:MAG: NADH-quinone oxidoreductase subunit C [Deltaproteobacteria bacterium CG11_big_fil_rev_8_21_14_0_20_47_16]